MKIKQHFWAGLAVLSPLAIAFWVAKILFNIMARPFHRVTRFILEAIPFAPENDFVVAVLAKIFSILALLILLGLLGYIANYLIGKTLLHYGEVILLKIPVVNKIYKSCKEITGIILSPSSKSLSKVVLIPYPTKSQLCLGFITYSMDLEITPGKKEPYHSVLVLGSPNPTFALLIFAPANQVQQTNIPADQAIKFLMSCGTASSLDQI